MKPSDPRLATYLDWLDRWNPTVGLISRRLRRPDIERQLVAPILSACAHLGPLGGHLLDIGAGSGMGGVLFGLENATLRVSFVERNIRKAAFIKQVCDEIGLGDRVRVFDCDVREMPIPDELADHVFLRGVADAGRILTAIRPALTADVSVMIVLPTDDPSPSGIVETERFPIGEDLVLALARLP